MKLRLSSVTLCVFLSLALCGAGFGQADCTITVFSSGLIFPAAGGQTTVGVAVSSNCLFGAFSLAPWITVFTQAGIGGGTIIVKVDQNGDLASRASAIGITAGTNETFLPVSQLAAGGDFSLSLSPPAQVVLPGTSSAYTVDFTRSGGFTGAIQPNPVSVPPYLSAVFSNIGTNSATLTLTASPSAPAPIDVSLLVTGVNAGVSRSVTGTANVRQGVAPTPALRTVLQGGSALYNLAFNRDNAFTGPIHLALSSALPNGVTASFSPNDTSATSSTLSVITLGEVSPGPYTLNIVGSAAVNGATVTQSATVILNINPPPVALRFVPVTECRLMDTRNPNGTFGGPFLAGGNTREIPVPSGSCQIPATAQAFSLNATVVPHGLLNFLTMFPCGQGLPLASNLNSPDGRVKAVAAIVRGSSSGSVCVNAGNDTDFILDINGYFVPATDPSGLAFYPLAPCRVADTRDAAGALGGPALVGMVPRSFPILSSACNVPATAQGYSLNFTVVPTGQLGFLATWPAGQTQPPVSTLNAPTGAVTANAAIVKAGAGGSITALATNNSDLIIDIDGYFASPGAGGLSMVSNQPCRVLDTRIPPGTLPFRDQLDVNVAQSECGIPATAQAFAFNATVVPPGPLGFLTIWPQGSTQPLVSTLNAVDGAVTSNMAIIGTNNGLISTFVPNPTQLILDISGYFMP